MADRSKLSLQERVGRPRAVATTGRRVWDDETVTYFVSVVIAASAMVAAAMAGFPK